MWDGFSDRLWTFGRYRKNLWLEGLWEHPLNSINGTPWFWGEDLLLH